MDSVDRMFLSIVLAFVLLNACVIVVAAADRKDNDKDEPIRIYADTIEIDDRTGIAVYRGDVSIQDGTLSIEADTVEAHVKDGDIETFFAAGETVRVIHRPTDTNQEMRATADRLEYQVKREKLYMFGNVTLQQNGSELRCPELNYDLEARRFVAKGSGSGERCHIFIESKNRSRSSLESGKNKK